MATWARPSSSMARTKGGETHALGLGPPSVPLGLGHRHEVGGDQGQEALPQMVDEVAGQLLGTEPSPRELGDGHESPAGVPLGQRLDDLVELREVVLDRLRRRHLVEDGQGVAGRAPAPAHGQVDGLVGDLEVGLLADLREQFAEDVGAQAGGTRSAGSGSG